MNAEQYNTLSPARVLSQHSQPGCGEFSIVMSKTYKTQVYVWSAIGHTPITGRVGSFCDELVVETVDTNGPEQARAYVADLLKRTAHAYSGYYYVNEYPNQNTRSSWLNRSSIQS